MPPASPFNADTRQLPAGWNECFDPHRQVWFYRNDLVNPPRRSYVHPLDALAQGNSCSSGGGHKGTMSFAQQLYASAQVQPNPPDPGNTSQESGTEAYNNMPPPPPLTQREDAPTPAPGIQTSNRQSSATDATAYAKQSERYAQLQAQSPSPSYGLIEGPVNGSGAGNLMQSQGPPPAFTSSSSSPPPSHVPAEPPEWQQLEHGEMNMNSNMFGSSLERRPTLPLYSPVAEEGLSYAVPEDDVGSLACGIDSLSIGGSNSDRPEMTGRGFADSIPPQSGQSESEVHEGPPPAFSDLPVDGNPVPEPVPTASRRQLPIIAQDVLSSAVPSSREPTRRVPSALAARGVARRVSGPRPGPAGSAVAGSANVPSSAATPRSPRSAAPASNTARPPSGVSSRSASSLSPSIASFSSSNPNVPQPSISGPVSGPPTESAAATYARSLYASAVANATRPAPSAQRFPAQRVANADLDGIAHPTTNASAGPAPAVKFTTIIGAGNTSGAGRAQSPSSAVVAPSPRPVALSIPQTQIQHLQAQAAAAISASASTAANPIPNAITSPPPLPQRRSVSGELAPVMQVQRLSTEGAQSQVQVRPSAQTPAQVQSQQQTQARPYRYSTAVVPPPTARSSTSSSFFGTPASSSPSSSYGSSSSWTAKTKKKTGGFFGVSTEKHKRLEAERRERERAAAERARIAQESEVARRVPPPPPPPKPAAVTGSVQTASPNVQANPYVAAIYHPQGQIQAQALQQQSVYAHPQSLQLQQNQNSALENVLSGINAGLVRANGRLQTDVSMALGGVANAIGNTMNCVTNAFTDGGSSDPVATDAGINDVVDTLSQLGSGIDLSTLTDDGSGGTDLNLLAQQSGIYLNSLTSGGEIDYSGLTNMDGIDLNAFADGSIPNSLDGVDLSAFNLSGPAVDLGGMDLSASMGGVEGGVFDSSSLPYGLDVNATGEALGEDVTYDSDVYGLEGFEPGTNGNTGIETDVCGTSTLDSYEFGVSSEDVDPATGMDSTNGFEDPANGSNVVGSFDPAAFSGADASVTQDFTSGFQYSDLYPDFLNAQNVSDEADQTYQDQEQLDQLNNQYSQYQDQLQDVYEQLQDGQQEQAEELQHSLEEQQRLEQQVQHQQQQEFTNLQHQLEEQAKHEQHAEQQLQHQLQEQAKLEHQMQQQLQQQNQTQAHATTQMLAQQQKIQQQAYAKMQAQMQAQAKMQAQYLVKLQKQQAEMQQQVEQHLLAQGPAPQTDATTALLESLKKMQEQQTQAMLKLVQMQLGTGAGNGGVGVTNAGKPQTGAALAATSNSQGGPGATGHVLRPPVGVSQHHAGGSVVNQIHTKPSETAGRPPVRPPHTSLSNVQHHTGGIGANEIQAYPGQVAHVKPPTATPGASAHAQLTAVASAHHQSGNSTANQAHAMHASHVKPAIGNQTHVVPASTAHVKPLPAKNPSPPKPTPNGHLQTMQNQQHLPLLTASITQAPAQDQQAQLIQLQKLQQLQRLQQLRMLQQAQQQAQAAPPLQQQTQAQTIQQLQHLHQHQQHSQHRILDQQQGQAQQGGSFSAGAQQELGRLATRAGVQLGGMLLANMLANNNNNN